MDASERQALGAWVGRERVEEDVLVASQARRLAATLERGPEALAEGDVLPPGWHWIYFGTPVPRGRLGPDGHERPGAFLPELPHPRRMWAGGSLRFEGPLRVGERASRRSTVERVTPKEGRSGPLVFVTVRHRIEGASGLAVDEAQELVYRPAAKDAPAPGAPRDASSDPGSASLVEPSWSERFVADEVTLFRFSALTFNAHRIHYDRPFSVEVEGYPGVVVHGPLLALLLLEAGVRHVVGEHERGGAAGWTFRYRALQPVFAGEPFELQGAGPDGTLRATQRGRGVLMEAELAPSE